MLPRPAAGVHPEPSMNGGGRMCDQLLLKVPDVARRLGLGRSFVYQHLIQSGTLPSIKVGGARRVLASDLEEFVRGLREASGDDQ